MKNKARVFLMIFVLLISSLALPVKTEASSARVMISDYQVTGDVVSGGDFKITITLKNTATKVVKNVKLTVYTENAEFYPSEGAGTAYISEIAADSEEKFTFKMTASTGLEEKSYKISARIEYDDYYSTEYEVEESVFIPVTLERSLSLTDIYYDDDVELGESVEITAYVNNTGQGTLYNVSAAVTGDNVYDQTSYVGNIAAGESKTLDFIAKSKKVQEDLDSNVIVISYEDEKGNTLQEEVKIGSIYIEEPQYDDLEKVVTKNTESVLKTYFKQIAFCTVAVIVIAFYIFLKWRRKKKISEEF